MFPNKFKTCTRINPGSQIKAFLCEFYGADTINKVVEYFVDDFEQNRCVLSNLNTFSLDNAVLSQNKNLLVKYLREILLLQQKLPGSDELIHVKFNFCWTDIFKQKPINSDNMFFEYYNTLFNLGLIYFTQATNNDKEYDFCKPSAQQCAEMWTLFGNALWCFNKIKAEINAKVVPEEIPIDMKPEVLDYFCLCCYIYAYKYMIIRSEEKANEYSNNSGLLGEEFTKKLGDNTKQRFSMANEISLMYQQLHEIASGSNFPFKLGSNILQYFLFQSALNKADGYHMLYDYHSKIFDKNGTNFPNAIEYLEKELEILKQWEKRAVTVPGSVRGNDIKSKIDLYDKRVTDMKNENSRIYHLSKVNYTEPAPEKISFFKPKEPEEMSQKFPDISPQDLDSLIPKEIREKLQKGVEEIRNFIVVKLENFMQIEQINQKIQEIKIPPKIIRVSNSNFINTIITNDLWERIEDVQQKGGTNCLFELCNEIRMRSVDLENKLNEYLHRLKNEEMEDQHLRSKFGNKWFPEPSCAYNKEPIANLQGFLMKLSKSQVFDQQKKDEISQNAVHFDILSLSREEIARKIPGIDELSATNLNPNELKIRQLLHEVQTLSSQNKTMINEIFANLRSNNDLVRGYMDVAKNLINEEMLLNQQKEKYAEMFSPLRPIEAEINNKLSEIASLCKQINQNPEIIQKQKQLDQQINNFLTELSNKINLYQKTLQTLTKGRSYYINEKTKVYNSINCVIRYLNKRNEERYILVGQMTRSRQVQPFVPLRELNPNENESPFMQQGEGMMEGKNTFLDSNKNLITNMFVGQKY